MQSKTELSENPIFEYYLKCPINWISGKVTKEDFIRKQKFQDATGRISEGMIINLKTVTIGNRQLYNVKASVINNDEAPLLLGQSALSKFGKVTIDNEKKLLILE